MLGFVASVFMQIAGDPGISQRSREPSFGNPFHIARTTAQYIDSATAQYIYGPLPHVSGQHHRYPHLRKRLGDVRLASATYRRGDRFLRHDFPVVVDGEYREVFTVAEVFIHLILT